MNCRFHIGILSAFIAFCICAMNTISTGGEQAGISQDVMVRAFDAGCSLAIVRVIKQVEFRHKRSRSNLYGYKVTVLRVLNLGDIEEKDVPDSINLFGGASYGNKLKPGKTYALFIERSMPEGFIWSFRDDLIPLDAQGKARLNGLKDKADRAYRKTKIQQFRGKARIDPNAPIPNMRRVLDACYKFRTNPHDRARWAREIWESDFGSKLDRSHPFRSDIQFLKPKHELAMSQILSLLGKPTLKSGFTYYWYCGKIEDEKDNISNLGTQRSFDPKVPRFGMLTVVFKDNGSVRKLLYRTFSRDDIIDGCSEWK